MDAIIAVQQAPKIVLKIKNVLRPDLAKKITKEFGTMGFWMSRIEPGSFLSEDALAGIVFNIIYQIINDEISMDLKIVKPELSDELNPNYLFSMTATTLLVQIAKGEINTGEYAKSELANRGIGMSGTWVGFKEAAKQWEVVKK